MEWIRFAAFLCVWFVFPMLALSQGSIDGRALRSGPRDAASGSADRP